MLTITSIPQYLLMVSFRDIKGANVKLADFGMAKHVSGISPYIEAFKNSCKRNVQVQLIFLKLSYDPPYGAHLIHLHTA